MARKRNKVKEPTREEQLTAQVNQLLAAETITPNMVYDLLLMGYKCYHHGFGLPHEVVWASILEGFKQHDRVYLTPGQNAALHGRDKPVAEDFEPLTS